MLVLIHVYGVILDYTFMMNVCYVLNSHISSHFIKSAILA